MSGSSSAARRAGEIGAAGRRSRVGFIPRSQMLGIYVFTWKIGGELVDAPEVR